MKLCVPVQKDEGLESCVCGHFGSAPFFILYDTKKQSRKTVNNTDQHHAHGACHPLSMLSGETIDVVLVGGIGARALQKFNSQGIRVFQSVEGTVEENVDRFTKNTLLELTADNACMHHGHPGGCGNNI